MKVEPYLYQDIQTITPVGCSTPFSLATHHLKHYVEKKIKVEPVNIRALFVQYRYLGMHNGETIPSVRVMCDPIVLIHSPKSLYG